MRIEDITTQVRPRTAWESIDLGLRMVQTWSKPIILSWLMIVLPICSIIYILLYQHPVLSIFIMWWLKPVFDRIPLYIVSHSVFGDIPTLTEIRKALPGLLKPHLIKSLIWYRLDPVRSFNLPVWQLEGLKSTQRAQRARVLQKGVYGTALALSYFSLFLQFIIWSACYALLALLLPTTVSINEISLFSFNNESMLPGLVLNIFAFISLSIIEPFYVAGGFALYLNRRTHLEAWDIELKFRSLAKRMSSVRTTGSKVASIFFMIFVVSASYLTLVPESQAKTANVKYLEMPNKQAKEIVQKVIDLDEFNKKTKTDSWQLKEQYKDFFKFKNNEKKDNNIAGMYFLGMLVSELLGTILYFVLGAVVIVIVFFLGFMLFKYLPHNLLPSFAKKTKADTIKNIFGLDLDPETLPDDIGATAWALWQNEKYTASLSLLYRGSLSKLVNRDGVKLPASATEEDCIKILKQSHIKQNKILIQYFESLTLIWQRAAYAHRLPEISDAKNLCETWSRVFHAEQQHDE